MKDKEITGTIEEELQNVLYYVTCLANCYGIDLEECVYLKEELNCKKYDRENIFKIINVIFDLNNLIVECRNIQMIWSWI